MDTLDYNITEEGKVFTLKKNTRVRSANNQIIPHLTKRGYHQVTLRLHGKSKHYRVHRLVASKFIPNPENLPEVNHKDGNKLNNHKDNLEWCTRLDNIKHSIDTNLKPMGENHHYSKWTNEQIQEVRNLLLESLLTISEISDKTGVSKNSIYKEKYGKGRLR